MIDIGTKAPGFTLRDKDDQPVSLGDFAGRWVVLYFYPKDDTSGCTKEALDFSDLLDRFHDLGAEVLGVSPDSTKSHVKFTDKHDLKVRLLSDPDKEVIKAYGAWGVKKNYGKEYEGLIRSTVIIDPQGKVAHTWHKVKVRVKRKSGEVRHADQVLAKLTELVQGGA